MSHDKEFYERQEYINELKKIKSEVEAILEDENDKELSRATKSYSTRINHLLVQRNIENVSGCFPFLDLAFIKKRNPNPELLDMNSEKDHIEQLRDIVRRIDRELE